MRRSSNGLVGFDWSGVGGVQCGKIIKVKSEGYGMGASQVKGVPKVHEEGGTMPTETILYEGIR